MIGFVHADMPPEVGKVQRGESACGSAAHNHGFLTDASIQN